MQTIGWKELIDFVEFGLFQVPAKIDTGAKTSVLHCENIQLIKKGRRQYVQFTPISTANQTFTLPFHHERKIKNSFGLEENRYVVNTIVRLFDQDYEMEISLRDRSNMEFPVLLGRSFIRKKFLVDVSRSNLGRHHTKKTKL